MDFREWFDVLNLMDEWDIWCQLYKVRQFLT